MTLVGLVSKNGILIVEFANTMQAGGLSKRAAVHQAAVTRLRPILMTTAATIAGHFPLTLVTGAGAQARNSIGLVLVGGMAIGTFFTLFVIQFTGWIATRIGKRRTFLITISLSLLGYAMKWFGYNPDHPYWLLFATPLIAFGVGSLFTLMGSMISDVCDYDELGTHQRREGVFGAIYWWMVKIGMSLAGLLTGVLLKVSKFDLALGSGQEAQTLFLLRIFDVGIPVITSAIAIWIIARYSLTESRVYEIRKELDNRHKKVNLNTESPVADL